MSDSILVRASRDGDQFHYLWAARRALQLLQPHTGLVAVTIEGASTTEFTADNTVEAGEELIDIAEYYGSTTIEHATLVRYMQLKHSTLHSTDVWQPSGLEKTVKGFAKRYKELQEQLPTEPLHEKLEFWFVTNRPVRVEFIEAVEDAAALRPPRHKTDLAKLKKFTSFDGSELALFCGMLRFEDRQDDYWTQRNILTQDISGYLPALDVDAPTRLKELVTRKALSESVTNPAITKMDVLRALQTNETELFPSPCLIEPIDDAVPRKQESELVEAIVCGTGRPVIVYADAGVGKSIFSTRIGINLPKGSINILYDCFGNGQYRSATGYRHRHRTALVQIANELSVLGLCHPLIPTNADITAYVRAFMHRITQSISVLRARNADALLCITVDAADNAQMAAEEINEPRSFVRDLIRESFPEGVHVVALCRPYRVALLNPPPDALLLELKAFSREETAAHLRHRFNEATEHDVDEFHRLSSQNPRVQAFALSRKAPLPEILRLLGPNPTSVESTIGDILEKSIATLRDAAGNIGGEQIDLICAGLAALRPLIPISVLASISGVDQAAIKSFALDLGRPLIVNGDTIQFFDEPSETWFLKEFRPSKESIQKFVTLLKSLTSTSAYVASALPQLMLEAGQFSELVELALTSNGLPETSPIERRDVELQRLQFALKACLRVRRYADAAKLALKAGGESAGNDRQRRILQDNIDLASLFMDSNSVQELVSRRTFGSGWVGSHHVYEAALLAGHRELIGEARSRLRMAEEWLQNWSKLSPKVREREPVSDEDRAVMAMAHFDIHGAKAAAESLRVWRPRTLSYTSGRILACRFLNHGRYDNLDELAVAADEDLGLILAIAVEIRSLHRLLPKEAAERGFKLLADQGGNIESPNTLGEPALSAVTAMIEISYLQGICDANAGKDLIKRFLPETPPYGLASRYSGEREPYMRAYALHAALAGTPLQLIDLATTDLRNEIDGEKRYSESQELRQFKEDIGSLIPWYRLWGKAFLGQVPQAQLAQAISDAKTDSAKVQNSYRDESHTSNEIAGIWIDVLLDAGGADKAAIREIIDWTKSLKRQLFTPTLNRLARLCAQTSGVEALAFEFAQTTFSLLHGERSDAQSKAEGYVDIARSVLAISPSDAEAYFNQAVEVASKIGDENLARWDALIELAERAARADRPSAEVAYKFGRCAEVTWDYVVRDKHFAWSDTVKALTKLCPSSSLAIISRWRDRRFGNNRSVLAIAIEALVSSGSLCPLDALAMVGFRTDWDENKLLEAALPLCSGKETKVSALNYIYRYMTLGTQSAKKWRRLENVATSVEVELPGLKERIADKDAEESADNQGRMGNYTRVTDTSEERNWDEVFAGCDITTSVGISVAHLRFRAGAPPFSTDAFFSEAIKRIPVGREAEFVKAFDGIAEFDLYSLRSLLDVFPLDWKRRLGIKTSLATVLKSFCRRFCMEIKRSRYYEVMPFEKACELSGLDESELLDVVLAEIGESTELAGPEQLFSLVGLLSNKLTHDEGLEALSYGLDQFSGVLEESDGDGPWTTKLVPPPAVEDSLAGYIWARLASPEAATRWEASHVVVTLCALERGRVLDGLFHHASANTTSPFGDPRFAFYSLHAQQWLLIATSRAALEFGPALAPHTSHFLTLLNADQPHVLIRMLAARTVLALADQGLYDLKADVREQLINTNTSPFETIKLKSSEELATGNSAKDELPENDRYFFGIDFGPYWLVPLGRCFGLPQPQIERETLKAIRGDLCYKGSHRWDEDERARLRLYEYEGTQHSHGSYPQVDNQGFYLSYHGMLIAAGRLLATTPLVEWADDWEDNRFTAWIARHDISRVDGRWLADRRDPQPASCSVFQEDLNETEWLGSISARDFEQAIYFQAGYMTIWGRWSNLDTSRKKSISVNTALVSRERSASLLRALQTTANPHDYRIPDANDDLQIDNGPYQLKGWVIDRPSESGIDESDPWAGGVCFPTPEPAAHVIELMQLSADSDRRLWSTPSCPVPALRSETWGYYQQKDSTEEPSGSRLHASINFVVKYLTATGMDLVIEVEIQRRSRNQRYDSRDSDELRNIPPSTRIFIVKGNGTIHTL